jgi:hypothetical protein
VCVFVCVYRDFNMDVHPERGSEDVSVCARERERARARLCVCVFACVYRDFNINVHRERGSSAVCFMRLRVH